LYRTQHNLEVAQKDLQIHQTELSHLRQQISQLEQIRTQFQNESEQLKQQCRQFEQQIFDKDQSKKNADLLIDQYRQQLTDEKQLRLSKNYFNSKFSILIDSIFLETDSEFENLRLKHLQLTTEHEQLNTTKKDFETNELNTRRKNEEINRSRQAILDRTRDEYEKLLRKYNDLDEVYRELVNLREKDTCKNQLIFLFLFFRLFQLNLKQFVMNLNVYIMKILN
jgi:chromosome segregation ATPase